ncbi:allophanate hydrolase [Falsochrobactrum shanghaiense]|uniref:Allophanate hydrolase n=1 Tax=Falsochrobactrum shanghaiense TaxID=2201899 RepID=A0A316J8K1_9HYPH|nr:biotin-dependent carboxyltransferase family protein [Falsochrobactrum shanghaiense]PWL17631.1 allophanate hydrolase [Falsochrobactrum shanghaiense]
MSEAVLTVTFAGPHVSVQDGGRPGFLRFGVPASGALDRTAFKAANIALGNSANSPAIEISMGGLMLQCDGGAVTFAVAGGGFVVDHAGQKRGSWMIATLHEGQKLAIRPGHWGSWCYLAFAGRLESDEWLGSAATHAMSGFGGGRLMAGRQLTIADAQIREDREGDFPCPVFARPRSSVHVTLGPQDRYFSPDAISVLLSGPWRMTDAWDRMGVRLAGSAIAPEAALDMPSEAILRGSVQVAGDGVATILLADHQATGGYPKIATVLDCELDALMQLRPRDSISFSAIDPQGAIGLARRCAATAGQYFQSLERPRGSFAQRLMSENLIDGVIDAGDAALSA